MDCQIARGHGAELGRVSRGLPLLELEASGANMTVAHGKHVQVLPLVPVIEVLVGAWSRLIMATRMAEVAGPVGEKSGRVKHEHVISWNADGLAR